MPERIAREQEEEVDWSVPEDQGGSAANEPVIDEPATDSKGGSGTDTREAATDVKIEVVQESDPNRVLSTRANMFHQLGLSKFTTKERKYLENMTDALKYVEGTICNSNWAAESSVYNGKHYPNEKVFKAASINKSLAIEDIHQKYVRMVYPWAPAHNPFMIPRYDTVGDYLMTLQAVGNHPVAKFVWPPHTVSTACRRWQLDADTLNQEIRWTSRTSCRLRFGSSS